MDCKATISIHAPPRGATHPDSAVHQARPPISIHAPPRGATAHGQRGVFALFISIHAPPRGATAKVWRQSCCLIISIHAPPRGATMPNPSPTPRQHFNSRPSARGDPHSSHDKRPTQPYFNSRPSARGDKKISKKCDLPLISIHAPPRGATQADVQGCLRHGDFNSRPSARGDALIWKPCDRNSVFQFTPLREGRLHLLRRRVCCRRFQFTPLREGRQQKICNFCKSFVQPLQISMA